MEIYCCGCNGNVDARLTDGREIYPHRPDLFILPFWRCDECGNYVGCHHKTANPTKPLGIIPTPALKAARQSIHACLDPLWKGGKIGRKKLYAKISNKIGKEYHTAELRTISEAMAVRKIVLEISAQLNYL